MQQSVQAVDFTSFVFASNGDLKTTSLRIAEAFGKTHAHVLRDIEKTITQVSDIFGKTNFGLSEYNQANNLGIMTSYKMYNLTKDGFIMVVMSYTGAKAFAIKEAYINAFNLMHAKLLPKRNGLVDLPPAYLTPAMKKHINRQVSWLAANQVGTTHAALGKSIQDKFNVNKREFIPVEKYAEVCAFLGCKPDAKALEGVLLEPVKVEYQPPEGMMLVAVEDFEKLRNQKPFIKDLRHFINYLDESTEQGYRFVKKVDLYDLGLKLLDMGI